MLTMCTAGLNACWDTATARHQWTEQCRSSWATSTTKQNRIYQFSERDL